MSDRTASRLALGLVALCCSGLLVFEWALGTAWLRESRPEGWVLVALAAASSLGFSWLAFDVWTSTADAA